MYAFIYALTFGCQKNVAPQVAEPKGMMEADNQEDTDDMSFTVSGMEIDAEVYGPEFSLPSMSVTVSDITKEPDQYIGKQIRFEAYVDNICQEAKCDMIVQGDVDDFYVFLSMTDVGLPVENSVQEYLCDVEGSLQASPFPEEELGNTVALDKYPQLKVQPWIDVTTVSCMDISE